MYLDWNTNFAIYLIDICSSEIQILIDTSSIDIYVTGVTPSERETIAQHSKLTLRMCVNYSSRTNKEKYEACVKDGTGCLEIGKRKQVNWLLPQMSWMEASLRQQSLPYVTWRTALDPGNIRA